MSRATSGFDLEAYLATEGREVEAALERALATLEPELPPTVAAPIRHGVTSGGKRLRPILIVAAYRACGGRERSPAELFDLAAPIELIHAYSLMHDDLPCMDDAPLRRGRPTPHTVYGEERTMVAGAALIPAAGLVLWRASRAAGLPESIAQELIRVLARGAGGAGMVGGQALDLVGEGRSLSRDELDDLHRRKTGALLVTALEMGAVAAEADPLRRDAMVGYGREIGLAFQIADDVLDATRTTEALGKRPSDAELGKSTYVRLLGVDGARREARDRSAAAIEILHAGAVDAPPLEALARFVVDRGH